MHKALISSIAAVFLLSACGQQAAEDVANQSAANQPAPADQAAGNRPADTVASKNAPLPAEQPARDGQAARDEPKTIAGPLGAAVAGRRARQLMHDRHEGMEDIGDAFKMVGRELKSDSPDMAELGEAAGTIARLAPQVTGWFPPGTGPDVGKTRAKAEIWRTPEDFVAKRRAFQQAAPAFHRAVRAGDLAAIRAASEQLGKTCKACHDSYRAPED